MNISPSAYCVTDVACNIAGAVQLSGTGRFSFGAGNIHSHSPNGHARDQATPLLYVNVQLAHGSWN